MHLLKMSTAGMKGNVGGLMKDVPVNLRKTGHYVIEVKMCNSNDVLSFIIRTLFQRIDSLKWFNRVRNSILRVCLLICPKAF